MKKNTMKNADSSIVSDDELYSNFIQGQAESFDELTIRYGDALIIYLNNILHNIQDAEDVTVEAFARILVKSPAIRSGGFRAYLYKTAHNLAMNLLKKNGRREIFSLDDSEEIFEISDAVEKTVYDAERDDILHLCMEKIDPTLKEILFLIYFEDMSYKEASAVMGISSKRVDKLLQTAKKHLKRELSKEGINHAYE